MKSATVVIGANYGDEGKGRIVDYLVSQTPNAIVVRFNGGAQAGHTVADDGRRHVFSHFGSGTLAGAPTFLAKHFVCNPILFWEERRRLAEFGITPVVVADPRCYVTTAYDMILNQMVEDARGDGRHGSVGVGFGETIERCRYPAFRLMLSDLADHDLVRRKVNLIRDRWVPTRSIQLGLPSLKGDARLSDEMLEKVIAATIGFGEAVRPAGLEFIAGKPLVFEGAQGLALDMDGPNFPHVTRSNTGLTNVVPIAKVLGLALDVVYATRTYLTKHGAGPLQGEYRPDPPIVDETNLDHAYQGSIRFAVLSLDDLRARIAADQQLAPPGSTMSHALTWMDHPGAGKLAGWATKLGRLRFYSAGPNRTDMAEIVS